MKPITAIVLVLLLVGFLGASSSFAQCQGCKDAKALKVESEVKGISDVKTEPNQTLCPVMGSPVNKEIYADHEGQRVYFCCAPCVDTFKASPEKYLKKMKKDGVVLEKAKVPCAGCAACADKTAEAKGEHKHGENCECDACKAHAAEGHEHGEMEHKHEHKEKK